MLIKFKEFDGINNAALIQCHKPELSLINSAQQFLRNIFEEMFLINFEQNMCRLK